MKLVTEKRSAIQLQDPTVGGNSLGVGGQEFTAELAVRLGVLAVHSSGGGGLTGVNFVTRRMVERKGRLTASESPGWQALGKVVAEADVILPEFRKVGEEVVEVGVLL